MSNEAKIILFRDAGFEGGCLTLSQATPDLVALDFNDVTSSLIVIGGEWNLYKDVDYKGTTWTVSSKGGPNGDGIYPIWSDWNGENDAISSLNIV